MKRTITAIAVTALLATTLPAVAGNGNKYGKQRYTDRARVVDVEPIRQVIEIPHDRTECWQEEISHYRPGRRDPGGMILGGVLGGVIGSQMGHGAGNKVATAAGTLIGATIGSDMSRDRNGERYTTSEQRCRVITDYREEERVSGYRVTYRYHGHTYTREMDYDPGKFVRVRVRAEPID